MNLRAPAKLNLCLYVGPVRPDGLHEICSVFCPLSLSDRLAVSPADRDEVVCEGIEGENLAAVALGKLRDRGWAHPPVRIEIEKRIPVAAGLGGGSADAAAVLRLAAGEVEGLDALAAEIGADVSSQLEPRPALVRGAGEAVEGMGRVEPFAAVLVPSREGLSTAEVYSEADRLGIGRTREELESLAGRLRALAAGPFDALALDVLAVNDLERATLSLRPEIAEALDGLRAAGAVSVMVAGSGPTVVGLCRDLAEADRVSRALPSRFAGAIVTAAEGVR